MWGVGCMGVGLAGCARERERGMEGGRDWKREKGREEERGRASAGARARGDVCRKKMRERRRRLEGKNKAKQP